MMLNLEAYRDKRVFLTGGSGFIGSHLNRALIESGAEVFAPTRAELDITDAQACLSQLQSIKPSLVFHLAADLRGRGNSDNLADIFHSNTAGTVYLLEACRQAQVDSVITCASADEIEGGTNLYGVSRAAATTWAQGFSRFSDINIGIARFYMVYGPGQNSNFFLPSLIDAIKTNSKLAMSPGYQTRDFTWVEDVVQALLRMGLKPDLGGQIFEICTGLETSLRELVKLVEELSGQSGSVNFGELPYRDGEAFRLVGDPSALEETIEYQPQTTLRQGLSRLLS